jgi:hypothetical protein
MSGKGERAGIVRVAGGPTSIMADLDDLEHACVGLERLEPRVTALQVPLRRWAEELPAYAAAAPGALTALERLRELEVHAVQVQEIARTTATSVRMSVDGYRAAERGARHAVERVQFSAGEAAGYLHRAADGGLTVDEMEVIVRNAPNSVAEAVLTMLVTAGLFKGAVKPLPATWRRTLDGKEAQRHARASGPDGEDARSLQAVLGAKLRTSVAKSPLKDPASAISGWVMDGPVGDVADEVVNVENLTQAALAHLMDQPVEVVGEVEEVTGGPASLDGGVASVLGLEEQVRQAGPGRIGITRVMAEDGADTYVVVIPGTQYQVPLEEAHRVGADGMEYMNAFGGFGIADAAGRRSEHTGAGVAAALAAAGVPERSRVVVVGHSQGGMHAVNLLSHSALTERFHMAGAYTFGAPTANLTTPEGVPVLHLEDQHDPVVAADGGPNPSSVDRVSVTLRSSPAVGADELRDYLEVRGRGDLRLPEHLRDVEERLLAHHHLNSYRGLVQTQEEGGPEAWGAAASTVGALGLMSRGRVVGQWSVPLGRREPAIMQQEQRHRPQVWPHTWR